MTQGRTCAVVAIGAVVLVGAAWFAVPEAPGPRARPKLIRAITDPSLPPAETADTTSDVPPPRTPEQAQIAACEMTSASCGALLLKSRDELRRLARWASTAEERGAALFALIAGPGLEVRDFAMLDELLMRETERDVLVQVLLGYLMYVERAPADRVAALLRSHPSQDVRRVAGRVLHTHPDPLSIRALDDAARRDADPIVRSEAALAVVARGSRHASVPRVIEALASENDPLVRASWINSLSRVPGPETRQLLLSIARSAQEPATSRLEAVETLVDLCVRERDSAGLQGILGDPGIPAGARDRVAQRTQPAADPDAKTRQ